MGAKALSSLLLLSTIGAAAVAGAALTRNVAGTDRIEVLEAAVADRDSALEQAQAALAEVAEERTQVEATLAETTEQLDGLSARYGNIVSGLPVTAATFDLARIDGTFTLVHTPVDASCVGFNDAGASCVAENFPADLALAAAEGGYVASSSWFPPVALTFTDGVWQGATTLIDSVSNTCDGALNPTTVELRVVAASVLPDELAGGWTASALRGSITLASPGTTTCVAASRASEFVTAAS